MLSVLAAFLLIKGTEALLPLVVEGNKFYQLQEDYTKPAESFTIFGVDYQPGGSSGFSLSSKNDVLTEPSACARDAYLLNKLGANAIRVYAVSPWNNHDECMSIFNEAGIYVLLDVNTPDNSINRDDPKPSYNEGYLNNVFGLVDAFKEYPNLLGFLAGNEIINDAKSASVDPTYIRAVVRDLKEYIHLWSNRTIPVGYAAADNLDYRDLTFDYLSCNVDSGNETIDASSRIDFFGINSYSWCSGVNDFQSSGYENIIDFFNSTSIPIIFTEYGCNDKTPRTFEEVDQGIYGPLSSFVSGGFVYEFSNEANNYGLVDIDDDGNVSIRKDYDNLKTAFSNVTTTQTTASSVATGTSSLKGVPTCGSDPSSSNSLNWNFNLPPCPATSLLESNGGNINVGTLVPVTPSNKTYAIVNAAGSAITPTYSYPSSYNINWQTNVPASILVMPVPGSAAFFGYFYTPAGAAATNTASATNSIASNQKGGSSGSASASKKNSASNYGVSALLGGFAGALLLLM